MSKPYHLLPAYRLILREVTSAQAAKGTGVSCDRKEFIVPDLEDEQ